ncbi:MAG: dihydroneopterin aldolase [Alistipes sp.]|nr:dihydroneopterin aldolase [Alistipes sp.]MBO5972101.1 dihydroneopterin aldolase [Alistipes sp.]MBO7243002.1 dihydroneopterin aldolase [Alistipes sp.]
MRLDGIYLRAFHGCYDLEQQVGNRFRVDVVIRTPLGDLPKTDDVTQAVNYLTVYEIVERTMQRTQRTVEAAAANIIEAIRAEFPQIVEIECTVAKIAPPLGGKIDKVSVTLIG